MTTAELAEKASSFLEFDRERNALIDEANAAAQRAATQMTVITATGAGWPEATFRITAPGPVKLDPLPGPPVPAIDPPTAAYRKRLATVGATALLSKLGCDEEIQRFQTFVLQTGLRFYSKPNVEAYLINQARQHNGLPPVPSPSTGIGDAVQAGFWINSAQLILGGAGLAGGIYMVNWTPLASYTLPIPSPVLETIERIFEAFPSATFAISEVTRYPDPFLMVVLHGLQFIVERWDEPAYRE